MNQKIKIVSDGHTTRLIHLATGEVLSDISDCLWSYHGSRSPKCQLTIWDIGVELEAELAEMIDPGECEYSGTVLRFKDPK